MEKPERMPSPIRPCIRPYRPEDQPAVFQIAAGTAFFGQPVEAYLEDRRLFCDGFYAYYTRFEAAHSWVASGDDRVIGFLMGCPDTAASSRRWLRHILPQLLARLPLSLPLAGAKAGPRRYRLGKLTSRYAARLARAWLRREFAHADPARYPAHLHINVDAAWRGQGLGRSLIEAYLDQLTRLGVPGVHLTTTSYNIAACRLYEKLGFRLLDARPTTIWEGLVPGPVENRAYGLRLSGVQDRSSRSS